MKKLFAVIAAAFALVSALPAAALDSPDASQSLRDHLRADRKTVVEHNLPLTPEQARKFWPVYESFQRELAPIQSRANRAMLDFISTDTLTETNARRLMDQITAADESEAKLRHSYVSKFSKAVGAKKAARYLQIEAKIRALERFDQAAVIPLVE